MKELTNFMILCRVSWIGKGLDFQLSRDIKSTRYNQKKHYYIWYAMATIYQIINQSSKIHRSTHHSASTLLSTASFLLSHFLGYFLQNLDWGLFGFPKQEFDLILKARINKHWHLLTDNHLHIYIDITHGLHLWLLSHPHPSNKQRRIQVTFFRSFLWLKIKFSFMFIIYLIQWIKFN